MLEQLKSRKTLFAAGKNSLWLLLDVVVKKLAGIIVGIQVARYLGSELVGVYNYAFVYIGFFAVIATFGIDQLLIRDLAKKEYDENAVLGTAITLKLSGALITSAIAMILAYVNGGATVVTYSIIIVAVGYLFNIFGALDDWFQARVEAKFPVIARNISAILISIAKLVAIALHAGVLMFVFLGMLELVMGWILLVPFYQMQQRSVLNWRFDKEYLKVLIKDGLPLLANSFIGMIGARADQLILGGLDKSAFGQYSIAVMISETAFIFASAVVASVFPSVVIAKKESEATYQYRMQLLVSAVMWLGILSTIGAVIFGPFIISFLFGDTFRIAGHILQVYVLSNIAIFWGTVWNSYAVTENKQSKILWVSILNAILNVALNIWAIPRYGAIGAATVNVVALTVSGVFSLFLVNPSQIGRYLKGMLWAKGIFIGEEGRPPLIAGIIKPRS